MLMRGRAVVATLMLTSAAGSDWCTQDSSRRTRLRSKFAKPDGFWSCAVVGSSGLLLQERLGEEIDRHDFVLRTNIAQVGGFETVVGSKTSARVMNTEALLTVLNERACPELKQGREEFCEGLHYGVFVNSDYSSLRGTLRDACGIDGIDPVLGRNDLSFSDHTIRHFQRYSGANVMTGAWAIALAMYLCPNGMDIYGYTHSANAKASRGAQYHCACSCSSTCPRLWACCPLPVRRARCSIDRASLFSAPADYDYNGLRSGVDSLSGTSHALDALARSQPRCVRLHTPSHLTTELPCAEQRTRRDPLVDGIRHWWGAGTYDRAGVPRLRRPVRSCPRLPPSPPVSTHPLCQGCPGVDIALKSGYPAVRSRIVQPLSFPHCLITLAARVRGFAGPGLRRRAQRLLPHHLMPRGGV